MALCSMDSLTLRTLTYKFLFNPVLTIAPEIYSFHLVLLDHRIKCFVGKYNRENLIRPAGNLSVKESYPINSKNQTSIKWDNFKLKIQNRKSLY